MPGLARLQQGLVPSLKRSSTLGVTALIAASLVFTTSITPVQAQNKGLGAATVGLAAGLVIGGALGNAAANKNRPPPQSRKKQRPRKSTSTRKRPKSNSRKSYTKRKSTTRRSTARRSAPSAPVVARNSELLQAKNALFLLGFLKEGVDSASKDDAYRAAVRAYQKEKRLAATGVLDSTQRELVIRESKVWSTLASLGSSETPIEGRDGAKRLQTALQLLGHYNGPIDGKIGAGSARAIAAYQSENGLPSTGSLTTQKDKADLIIVARTTVKNDLQAVKMQLGQISQQQLASITGKSVAKATAQKVAAPAAAAAATAAIATPSLAQGYLPSPDVKKASLNKGEAGFLPIEPIRADAAVLRPNDVAVIIGNRDYRGDIPDVSFGHRDAQAMKSLLINELGFSKANIIDARDAGQAELVAIFGSESNNRGKVWRLIDPDGKSNVFVFYSGHGAPDTQSRTPYLMPVDSHPDTIELNGYPLSQMYTNLESLDVKSVAVFLDACFSGGSAGGMLTQAASPVAVTAKMPTAAAKSNKLTVLAAAEGDQLASWNEKAGFGLFTNYLVDGLKGKADEDGDKAITAGELHHFVHDKVRRSARRQFGRIQTPVLMGKENRVLRAPNG